MAHLTRALAHHPVHFLCLARLTNDLPHLGQVSFCLLPAPVAAALAEALISFSCEQVESTRQPGGEATCTYQWNRQNPLTDMLGPIGQFPRRDHFAQLRKRLRCGPLIELGGRHDEVQVELVLIHLIVSSLGRRLIDTVPLCGSHLKAVARARHRVDGSEIARDGLYRQPKASDTRLRTQRTKKYTCAYTFQKSASPTSPMA